MFILMKQAKKNSFKILPSICSRASCAIFRINHVAKTISLLASRMPVPLEVFLQFSFSNIVFMFSLHYSCSVLCSRKPSRKAVKSKRLVLLLYGNQGRNLCFIHKTTYLWSKRGPWGGELFLSACPGVGNRQPSENKIANPRGYARGGHVVTGRLDSSTTERRLRILQLKIEMNLGTLAPLRMHKNVATFVLLC